MIAVATVNSFHLVGHLMSAGRVRTWNPGSVTAAVTLPLNAALIAWAFVRGMSPAWWLAATVILGLFFAVNLRLLHRLAPAIQHRVA